MRRKTYPEPLYAVAGASDLAMRRLRTLPTRVKALRGEVNELRDKARDVAKDTTAKARGLAKDTGAKVRDLAQDTSGPRLRSELDQLGRAARRGAVEAQRRAVKLYGNLVAHGEHVVNGGNGQPTAPAKPVAVAAKPAGTAAPAKKAPAKRAPRKTTKSTGNA